MLSSLILTVHLHQGADKGAVTQQLQAAVEKMQLENTNVSICVDGSCISEVVNNAPKEGKGKTGLETVTDEVSKLPKIDGTLKVDYKDGNASK